MTQHGQTDGPEYLDSREGSRLPQERRGRTRRTVAVVAAGVGVLAVGGAAWAAWSFFSTGAQPAEALPASTIAYASIDLDPSGGQKIEALRTLRKFPAFKDEVGIGKDADVREWIVDQASKGSDCDLDFDKDVKPWLGNRFAIAAVDSGDKTPDPVFVLQVSDEGKAKKGLDKIRDCGGGSDAGAWSISDGWAVVGETQDIVDGVTKAAAKSSLADDSDFKSWTDKAGDSGILSMYAAPAAGQLLADNLGSLSGLTGAGMAVSTDGDLLPPASTEALKDFQGAAATLRFDDGGLELEVAADPGKDNQKVTSGDRAGDAVTSLPKSTVAAFSLSLGDGWGDQLMKQLDAAGLSSEVSQVSSELGLDLPGDAETLAGDALTVALDGDADLKGFFESGSGDDLGVGVKVLGDADDVDGVLAKLRDAAGGQDQGFLDSDTGDGVVAFGPDADFRKSLVKDGGLGGTDTFKRVVEDAKGAAGIFYVDFDGGDDWLVDLAGDDDDVRANLKPLDALGISSWQEDGVSHGVLKITTD